MNISSAVVSTSPHETENLQKKSSDLARIDINEMMEYGRVFITIEDTPANHSSRHLDERTKYSGPTKCCNGLQRQ